MKTLHKAPYPTDWSHTSRGDYAKIRRRTVKIECKIQEILEKSMGPNFDYKDAVNILSKLQHDFQLHKIEGK